MRMEAIRVPSAPHRVATNWPDHHDSVIDGTRGVNQNILSNYGNAMTTVFENFRRR